MEKPQLTKEDLAEQIKLIVESEIYSKDEPGDDYLIVDDKLKYDNSDRLMKIYSLIEKNIKLRNEFINLLLTHINTKNYNEIYNTFTLIIFTLLRLNKTTILLDHLDKGFPNEVIFMSFYEGWAYLSKYFTEAELIRLKQFCNNCKGHYSEGYTGTVGLAYPSAGKLHKILVKQLLEVLDNKLEDNFEFIQQDITEFTEKITNYNFNDKIVSLIQHINEMIISDPNEHDVAGQIGNFRDAFGEFIKDLAEKIKDNEGDSEIPKTADSDTGNCRNYIRDKFGLSKKDKNIYNQFHKLLDAFVEKLHSEGGHSYYTNAQSLKFVRNIGIPLITYLTECYETYLNK